MARNAIGGMFAVIPVCVLALAATLLALSSGSPQIATTPTRQIPSAQHEPLVTTVLTLAEPTPRMTYRGRIVTEDGSPLPADLKLQRRVSYESTQETPVDEDGEFSFQTDSIRKSVRFSMTGAGFAPFDSKWLKLNQPIELTLVRGGKVQLRLVAPDGTVPSAGTASLLVPWCDQYEQGTFTADASGVVTIDHCPLTTVNLDVLVPGCEELRIRRIVQGDVSIEVPLQAARPVQLRVVSAEDGRPIDGAEFRFFSRTRAGAFLMPFQSYGDSPVWGETDADGRVALTTLRAIDPVRTNDPGAASYCFRVDAPGYAPHYIGDVRAGNDLGEIQLSEAIEVRGEVARDAQNPERISFRVRQPTIAHGGYDGRGLWQGVDLVEDGEKLTFHLKGFQPGPVLLSIVYSDASVLRGTPGGSIAHLHFHGELTGSSSNLVITRESVVPGDEHLSATRSSLNPTGSSHRSNVPLPVVAQLETLFAWSHTASIQRYGGRVSWRAFVLRDGTLFVPGSSFKNAGTHHKLSSVELEELNDLLESRDELFSNQFPTASPEFAAWDRGHETLSYTREGQTRVVTSWSGRDGPFNGAEDTAETRTEIKDFVNRLIANANRGGSEARAKYRAIANQSLMSAFPQARPFQEEDWTHTGNHTDGTRSIAFASGTDSRTRVTLIDPAFGEPYVERIEHLGQRVDFENPVEQD